MAVQWEYCDLRLIYFNVEQSRPESEEKLAQAMVVKYHTPDGKTELKVLRESTLKQLRSSNPVDSDIFGMALGRLGFGGWELVTIYKEEDRRDMATSTIAYFKRTILEGRPTTEPAIEL